MTPEIDVVKLDLTYLSLMDKGKNKAGMSEGSSNGRSEINTDCQKNSKLRVLLYDADVQSSQQCSNLLRQCSSSYQGTPYMYIYIYHSEQIIVGF